MSKLDTLSRFLAEKGPFAVAVSGGVDSMVFLYFCILYRKLSYI